MRPAKREVHNATYTRLSGAISDPVRTDGEEVPGVQIGEDDESTTTESTSTETSVVGLTIYCRALTKDKAKALAETVTVELTDRDDLLALNSPFYVMGTELIGSALRTLRRVEGPTIYENIVRIDLTVNQ